MLLALPRKLPQLALIPGAGLQPMSRKRRAAALGEPGPAAEPGLLAAVSMETVEAEPAKAQEQKDTTYKNTKLHEFLTKAFQKLSNSQKQALEQNITEVTSSVASMCSGSGMAELTHHALLQSLGIRSRLLFSCESVAWKQKHLETIHTIVGSPACVFQDFQDISKTTAPCAVHGQNCRVDFSPFMAIAGYSCKDMSPLRGKPRGAVLPKREGSSGATCQALLSYLQSATVPIVILENVPEMGKAEEASKNVAYLHGELRARGYEVKNEVLTTCEFLLPQRRKRAWTVAIRLQSFGLTRQAAYSFLSRVFAMVEAFKEPPLSLDRFFQPPSHELVRLELKRRQESARSEHGPKDWAKLHQEFMAAKGMSWRSIKAPASVQKSAWFSLCPKREQEIVTYALAAQPGLLSVDISMRIDRASITSGDSVATLTPGSKPYLMYHQAIAETNKRAPVNRLMLGYEGLELQGFPVQVLQDTSTLSDPQMMDLAGNAFSSTVLMSILLSIFCQMPDFKDADKMRHEAASADEMKRLFSFLITD